VKSRCRKWANHTRITCENIAKYRWRRILKQEQKIAQTIQITANNIFFTNYREQLEIVQYILECREQIPQQRDLGKFLQISICNLLNIIGAHLL
jgi:hypothetical protein